MPVAGAERSGGGRSTMSSWQVEDKLTMLLEQLARQNPGKDVRRIRVTGDVAHIHNARATQLSHFEELAVDMTRVLGGRETMAQVVGSLAVREHVHWICDLMP